MELNLIRYCVVCSWSVSMPDDDGRRVKFYCEDCEQLRPFIEATGRTDLPSYTRAPTGTPTTEIADLKRERDSV